MILRSSEHFASSRNRQQCTAQAIDTCAAHLPSFSLLVGKSPRRLAGKTRQTHVTIEQRKMFIEPIGKLPGSASDSMSHLPFPLVRLAAHAVFPPA